jgi:hypothetical protein
MAKQGDSICNMNEDLQNCGCAFPNATSISVNDDLHTPSPIEMASLASQAAPVGSYRNSTKKGKGSSKTSLKAKKGNGYHSTISCRSLSRSVFSLCALRYDTINLTILSLSRLLNFSPSRLRCHCNNSAMHQQKLLGTIK